MQGRTYRGLFMEQEIESFRAMLDDAEREIFDSLDAVQRGEYLRQVKEKEVRIRRYQRELAVHYVICYIPREVEIGGRVRLEACRPNVRAVGLGAHHETVKKGARKALRRVPEANVA